MEGKGSMFMYANETKISTATGDAMIDVIEQRGDAGVEDTSLKGGRAKTR